MTTDSGDKPAMTVYGAAWCPHCKRLKRFLAAHKVRYAYVDVDAQPEAIERIKELQGGAQIIPTVVYPDGTFEVNPSNEALARRIGLTLTAERSAYDLVIVGGGPAARPRSATGSTTTRGSPTASPARSWPNGSWPRPAVTGSSSSRRYR